MSPSRWQRVRDLFQSALERPEQDREAWLSEACPEDPEIRAEVARMLELCQQAPDVLEGSLGTGDSWNPAQDEDRSGALSQVGPYRLLREIGRGGMGVVYQAHDARLDRYVALKFLPSALRADPSAKARFLTEAKAASALDHPNICTIYDIGETEDGRIYIAMAFYEGETLQDRLSQGPLPVAEALNIAVQVGRGLECAHEAGIVHRDIKPSNIMLTSRGEVKILDFGVAKLAGGEALTGTDVVVGTPAFMSPEQLESKPLDVRTDLWSLGMVLYQMLAGRRPFDGDGLEILKAILVRDPPSLRSLRSEVPASVESIVRKLLAKDRNQRYQRAADLLSELEEARRSDVGDQLEVVGSAMRGARGARGPAGLGDVLRRRSVIVAGGAALLLGFGAAFLMLGGRPAIKASAQPSVAVLPLENLSLEPETDWFSDGVTEEIITQLSKISELKVISRNSVMVYKNRDTPPPEIAGALGVASLLRGSVQQVGERVRIFVQLIDARADRNLWAETYDRELEDIFAIQSDVALRIAEALRARLTPEEDERVKRKPTANLQAYNLYLKGLYLWNKRTPASLSSAIEHFERAAGEDPEYALAYAGLAGAHGLLGVSQYASVRPSEVAPKARAAAIRALELDQDLAEAHTSLAFLQLWFERDWPAAERSFKRALELNPNYPTAHQWYSLYLRSLGRHDEVLEEMAHARALDPLSPILNVGVGEAHYFARRFDLAIEHLRASVEQEPDFWLAHHYLALPYLETGQFAAAVAAAEKAVARSDRTPAALAGLGRALALSGRRAEAIRVRDELRALAAGRYVSPINEAFIAIGLGEKESALSALERAYEEREEYLIYAKISPAFDSLRSEPQFSDLLSRLNIPD